MHFSALFFVGSEQVNSGLINAYLKSTRRVQQNNWNLFKILKVGICQWTQQNILISSSLIFINSHTFFLCILFTMGKNVVFLEDYLKVSFIYLFIFIVIIFNF